MAQRVTTKLSGAGLWGVEFFLTANDVYFSELSPRPNDTGMVTLGNTQNLSEFELHARAILCIPIPQIIQYRAGASVAILASENSQTPQVIGVENALEIDGVDIRIFGKPSSRPNRRMAVILTSQNDQSAQNMVKLGLDAAKLISVSSK